MTLLAFALAPALLSTETTVKAEILGGYIIVDVRVNDKPAKFILDTGAEMTVIVPEAAKRLGATGGVTVNANGTGSDTVKARITQVGSMSVGSFTVKDAPVAVIPLPPIIQVDGLVGHGFLSQFVTTVDYDRGQVTFTQPADFKAPESATVLPMRLSDGVPQVEVEVEGLKGWADVDTGNGVGVTLNAPFVDENKLRDRFPNRVTTVTGGGVGGYTMGELARLSSLKLGPFALPELVVELSSQRAGVFAKKGVLGNIGSDVLSRFTVTFDYAGSRMLLARGRRFNAPPDANRSGVFIDFDGLRTIVVAVAKGSPGEAAGLAGGDQILELDGKPVGAYRPLEVRAAFRRPAGTVLQLKVKDASGATRDLKLTLKDWV